MYKITKTYEDFDGVERTESFYFNLTEAEITEMQLSTTGGLTEYIKRIVDAKDSKAIIAEFKSLVLKAYGVKSDDGRRFIKSQAIADEFASTAVYSDIFMELAFDSEKAAEFVNGVTPKTKQKMNPPAK